MSISAPTSLSTEVNLVNQPSYNVPTAGTVTLRAGRLYVLFVRTHKSGTAPNLSLATITGQAGTWTFLAQSDPFFVGTSRIGAWRYIPALDEVVTLVVNFMSGNVSNAMWSLVEIASGFADGNPIGLASGSNAEDPNPSRLPITLPGGPGASSLSLVGVAIANNTEGITSDPAFTQVATAPGTGSGSDSGRIETEYKDVATQTCTPSASLVTNDWGGIHLEIVSGEAGAPDQFLDVVLRKP